MLTSAAENKKEYSHGHLKVRTAASSRSTDQLQLNRQSMTVINRKTIKLPDGTIVEDAREERRESDRSSRTIYTEAQLEQHVDLDLKKSREIWANKRTLASDAGFMQVMYGEEIGNLMEKKAGQYCMRFKQLEMPLAELLATEKDAEKQIRRLDLVQLKLLAPPETKLHEEPRLLAINTYLERQGKEFPAGSTGRLECKFAVVDKNGGNIKTFTTTVDEFVMMSIPSYRSMVQHKYEQHFLAQVRDELKDEVEAFMPTAEELEQLKLREQEAELARLYQGGKKMFHENDKNNEDEDDEDEDRQVNDEMDEDDDEINVDDEMDED